MPSYCVLAVRSPSGSYWLSATRNISVPEGPVVAVGLAARNAWKEAAEPSLVPCQVVNTNPAALSTFQVIVPSGVRVHSRFPTAL